MVKDLNVLWMAILVLGMAACSGSGEGDKARQKEAKKVATPVDERIADLSDRILQKPNNPNLYVSRALAYSEQDMHALALKDIDRALRIDSTVSFIHATKGEIFFKTGDLRSARLSLERASLYDPENTEALLKLGEVNYLLRRYPEALTSIDQALRVNDRQAQGYFLKGFIFKELGDTTRSLSSFQTAVEVNPEFYEAYMELAHIQAYRGKPITLDYLNTALELRPNSVEAYYHLGLFYQAVGDYDESTRAYRNMLKLDPKAYLGYYNLGYIYLTASTAYDTALAYFDSVLMVQPNVVDAAFNRGLCYEEMGKSEKAVEVYQEVLAADPQHTLAAMGLERLLE